MADMQQNMQDEEQPEANAPDQKSLLQKLREAGPAAKKATDDWLDEHVNQPMAAAGHPEVGAGLSAVGSAAADMAIPENEMDLAMMALPVKGIGKLGKVAKAGETAAIDYSKFGRKVVPFKETAATTGFEFAKPVEKISR